MKNTKLFSFWALLICSAVSTFAQVTVSGRVTDSNGDPLAGATVMVPGTGNGTAANSNGDYSIRISGTGSAVVQASMVGFSTVRKSVALGSGNQALNFQLAEDMLGLDEVVVTGNANEKSKLESSISISTLNPGTIAQTGARSTAEILRSVAGVRSEASGGDGNTNITVRGVPISSGGSKYLQLQEDGLPVLLFGDMSFATADIFLRADGSTGRLEALRGGSASVTSTNSPAGIMNFISNTGSTQGGSILTSVGVDNPSYRTDFGFGGSLSENLSFAIGGFFRQGEGGRSLNYTGNRGGQIKANLTRVFSNGYARLYMKHLNDRAAAFMPMPMMVTGTNDNPTWGSIAGYDALTGTMHTTNLAQTFGFGGDGSLRRVNVSDGMHAKSNAVGAEFSFDLGDGWNVENKARMATNGGRFVAPFPAEIASAASLAASVAGTGATAVIAGTNTPYTGTALRIHMFDTELNNFDNMMNDLKISKKFGTANVTLGYFKGLQNVDMSWHWNSFLQEAVGENARLLNAISSTGVNFSDNGLYAYGVPAWGNCCQRNYNTQYNISAPYLNIEAQVNDALNVELGLRKDNGHVTGNFAGAVQRLNFDMNGNGVISRPEQSISVADNANTTAVNYRYDYLSYSAGMNYKMNNESAIFARYSSGGSAKADRILFNGLNYQNGDAINAKDLLAQAELGYKLKMKNGGLFITGFYSTTTEEGGYEATTQQVIENDYKALGAEVEGAYTFGDLGLRGSFTFTDAEITSGTNKGKTPRRQAALIYNLNPSYNLMGKGTVGLNIVGTTDSYAQDDNLLVMPGYTLFHGYLSFNVVKGLSASINGNNLFNKLGVTESEEGSIPSSGMVRARPVLGRSINIGLGYNF
jgi:outer membrane receptor protein involved in Fe transport